MTNSRKRRLKYNAGLVALALFVVISLATALGYTIVQATYVDLEITDDVIASVYIVVLVLLYQVTTWLTPKRR